MLRWFLLFLSFASVLLGALTVFKSPDWSKWQLALLAGEFGYFIAVVPLVVAFLAWMMRRDSTGPAIATVGLGLLAVALLLKPVMQASNLAQTLPEKLTRELGREEIARAPFSLGALFGGRPEPVPVETMNYAGPLELDFYRAVGRAHAPCVLLVHGGGWDSGDKGELPHFNHWLARRGYAVAAISYRLAPQFPWPAARDDITAAIAFLKSHAASLGIDATRLVLLGRSAGGQLVEATAYATPDPAIRGVVALYAPADVHFAWEFARDDDVLKSPVLLKQFLGGTPETARAAYDAASPIQHVGKSTPPTLLIHGQLDTLVWHRQSERLDQKLTEAGVRHAFISLPWTTHAFEYNLAGPGGQLTTYSVEWFLATVTK